MTADPAAGGAPRGRPVSWARPRRRGAGDVPARPDRPRKRRSTIHEQIASNRRRAAVLLAAFLASVVVVGFAVSRLVGGGALVVAALVFGLAVVAAAYLVSDRVALSLSRARPADAGDHPRYHNLVEGLCVAAGLPKPDLYVVDDDAPNAFAIGRSPQHAAVVATSGLLDKLTRVELEGVLAHELSHIRNHDTLVTTMAVTLVGLPTLPFGWLSARLVEAAVGPRREAVADLTGVRLTRYPPGLIAALEKIRADSTVVRGASPATAHLWIEWPRRGEPAAQPPLADRIAALRDL